MGKKYNADDFNPKDSATDYNAAQRRHEARDWLAGQHGTGSRTGYERAAQGLRLEINDRS